MDLPPVTQCRSCSALIRWVVSENGVHMPIDAAPSDNGNLYLYKADVGGRCCAQVMVGRKRDDLRRIGRLYISHHATCPQGREWRRKREKQGGAP